MKINLASERIKIGYTQAELAKALNVSQQTVNRWERGETFPQSVDLVNMHNLFGCTTDYLLGLTDERK